MEVIKFANETELDDLNFATRLHALQLSQKLAQKELETELELNKQLASNEAALREHRLSLRLDEEHITSSHHQQLVVMWFVTLCFGLTALSASLF